MVVSLDRDADFFDIAAEDLLGNIYASYLFIICLDYVFQTSLDLIKENGFTLKKKRKQKRTKRYPAKTKTNTDNKDNLTLLMNKYAQAESLLHSPQ